MKSFLLPLAGLIFGSHSLRQVGASPFETDGTVYNVGMSKVDVTGPVAHVNMMGYADVAQRATGLLNRLYARTFVVEDMTKEQRVLIIHCDIHSIPLQLHESLIERLAKEHRFGKRYSRDNVLIHAQHTHSGPGGLHTFYLYYLSVLGFTPVHFEMVLDRLVESVRLAESEITPRKMMVTHTEIQDCSVNRSPEAYMQNPVEERERYASNKNTRMTIVKIVDAMDEDTVDAIWTFFPVHTTSLVGSNSMISSDNKGYAEWLLETKYAKKNQNPNFVAAFFQSEAGDISPNVVDKLDGTFTGKHKEDFVRNAEHIGRCQANAADDKLESEETEWQSVFGQVLSKKKFFDFSDYQLSGGRSTCAAASGINMLAGTEDGRGVPFIVEGGLRNAYNSFFEMIGRNILVPASVSKDFEECHAPKVPLFATGLTKPASTPQILPMQVLTIGSFTFAALPFEVTTMAGRRISETVFDSMRESGQDCNNVVIAAVSNAYAGYLTTREEYLAQHYEGACTHFGKYQLEAVQDMLHRVISNTAGSEEKDPVLSVPTNVLTSTGTKLVDDLTWAPPHRSLGDTYQDIERKEWNRREVVSSSFWCTRPMNSQFYIKSFCDVEQLEDSIWKPVLHDGDWNVRFKYSSKFLLFGLCTCQWVIPEDTDFVEIPSGPKVFRLKLYGAKSIRNDPQTGEEVVEQYEGTSSSFSVTDAVSSPVNMSLHYNYGIPEEILTGVALAILIYILLRFVRSPEKSPSELRKFKSI